MGVGLAKENRERAEAVQRSIETLDEFFAERARQCFLPNGEPLSQEVLEIEKGLYAKYSAFCEALGMTSGALEMDSTAVMPDREEGWQTLVLQISNAFDVAMSPTNERKPGISEKGPRTRFIRMALVQMGLTSADMTLGAVYQALLAALRGIQRSHRKPRLQVLTSSN